MGGGRYRARHRSIPSWIITTLAAAVQPQLRLMHLELIFSSPFAHAAPVKHLPPTPPASGERSETWGQWGLSGAEGLRIDHPLPSLNVSWFLLWRSQPGALLGRGRAVGRFPIAVSCGNALEQGSVQTKLQLGWLAAPVVRILLLGVRPVLVGT